MVDINELDKIVNMFINRLRELKVWLCNYNIVNGSVR